MIYMLEYLDKTNSRRYTSSQCREILSNGLYQGDSFPIKPLRLETTVNVSKKYIPEMKRIIEDIFGLSVLNVDGGAIFTEGKITNPFDIGAIFYLFKADVSYSNPMLESGLRKIKMIQNSDLYTRMYIALRRKINESVLINYNYFFGCGPRTFISEYLIGIVNKNPKYDGWIDTTKDEIQNLVEAFKENRLELIDTFLQAFYNAQIFDINLKLK